MLEALFGTEMPLAVRFFIAFVFVLALMGALVYGVRRFGPTALNAAGSARGRQPRLGVIEATAVGDGRRRLLLIRRDNVEHLIMIGGPSDVVIEPNIVRATSAAPARETPPARVTGGIADALPRAVPLAEGGMWPLQPEPRPQRASAPGDDDANWSAQSEPAPRAAPESLPRAQNSDRLGGLSADLARGFVEPEAPAASRRGAEARRAAPAPAPAIPESDDQNLAEMAHRLESALHRPRQSAEPAAEPSPPPAPRANEAAHAEPKAIRPEPKPAAKPAFDSLEQEMASLLGRPSGKP